MDNRNYIRENIKLIQEILNLRKNLKMMKTNEKPETIILRKKKRLMNILGKKERNMTLAEKKILL